MNDSLKRGAFAAQLRHAGYAALAVVALALCGTGPRAQTTPVLAATDKPGSPMKPFVFLFRQSSPLSEAERKRRAEEVRAWAMQLNRDGHKLDPRILGEEKHQIGADGKESSAGQSQEAPLSAILFVEAHDFAEAVRIAKSHPALRYGIISVEVRAWSSPPASAAPSQS
jgi:hypothetical protein